MRSVWVTFILCSSSLSTEIGKDSSESNSYSHSRTAYILHPVLLQITHFFSLATSSRLWERCQMQTVSCFGSSFSSQILFGIVVSVHVCMYASQYSKKKKRRRRGGKSRRIIESGCEQKKKKKGAVGQLEARDSIDFSGRPVAGLLLQSFDTFNFPKVLFASLSLSHITHGSSKQPRLSNHQISKPKLF